MSSDQERTLQRLADGELNHQDRLRLLEQAESDPQLWREIALSFIESQQISEELSTLYARPVLAPPHQEEVELLHPRNSIWRFAAALIAMLTIGIIAGHQVPRVLLPAHQADTSSINPLPMPTTKRAEAATDDATPGASGLGAPYRMLLATPTKDGRSKVLEVPAYDEGFLEKKAKRLTNNENGWALDWQTNVWSGELRDGRRVFVPVSMPQARYRGQ